MYQEKRDEGSLDAWATAGTDVEVDRVFPNWMIARDDFKLVFTRFNGPGAGGGNRANNLADDGSVDSVGAALGVNGQSRSHEDLQLLAQWLKEHSKVRQQLWHYCNLARTSDQRYQSYQTYQPHPVHRQAGRQEEGRDVPTFAACEDGGG